MNGLVRIVPRLDVKGPNVVKGIQFDGFRVLGTVEHFAELYYKDGADELIYQDTVASLYRRNIDLEVVKKTARRSFIPLTVAGGVRSIEDIRQLLRAGADKVAINTAALEHPELIREAARVFGSQCIVASLEVFRQQDGSIAVWTNYGRQPVEKIDPLKWAESLVSMGAGEIMLSAIHRDGYGKGFDLELVEAFSRRLPVPVIACCGAGSSKDFVKVAKQTGASAISAASIFHYHYPQEFGFSSLKDRYRIRYGAQDDTGNVDFMMMGYGGIREFQVEPISIRKLKLQLREEGVKVRV